MSVDWLTLPEAADKLNVSARTLRRWIKEQKIEAELRPGPYGQTYYISEDSIERYQNIEDAVIIRPTQELQVLRSLQGYLSEQDNRIAEGLSTITESIDTLREEVKGVVETKGASTDAKLEEVTQRIDELASLVSQMQQSQQTILEAQQEKSKGWKFWK